MGALHSPKYSTLPLIHRGNWGGCRRQFQACVPPCSGFVNIQVWSPGCTTSVTHGVTRGCRRCEKRGMCHWDLHCWVPNSQCRTTGHCLSFFAMITVVAQGLVDVWLMLWASICCTWLSSSCISIEFRRWQGNLMQVQSHVFHVKSVWCDRSYPCVAWMWPDTSPALSSVAQCVVHQGGQRGIQEALARLRNWM